MANRFTSAGTCLGQSCALRLSLIYLVLIGALSFSTAWLSPWLGSAPALAQSDADQDYKVKKAKANQGKIKKLEAEQQKNFEDRAKLYKENAKYGLKPLEQQKIKKDLKKNLREGDRISDEIKLRKMSISEFSQEISNAKKAEEAAKQVRTASRERLNKVYCNKNSTEVDKKKAREDHRKANAEYFKAKGRVKYLKKLAVDRFGLGQINQFESEERKAEEQLRELRKQYRFRRILLPGDDDPEDDSFIDSYEFEVNLTCGPDETGTLTALTIPIEPKPITVAVQIPEVCVGTTYVVTREDVLEEGLPIVTEDGEDPRDVPNDSEDPRDVPREDIPVTSTPQDDDDPRDTPKTEVPVASVPKEVPGDDPRDVPREDTPGNRTTDIPVTSTPEFEDEPRDTPQDEPVPDLGKIKAVAEIVALAVTNAVTGTPVTGVGIKFLPEEPPLPGSRAAEASSDAGEAFDEASFFEEDAEGGFTDEAGEIELSSLVIPIDDPAPADNQPEKTEKKKEKKPFKIPSADEIEKMTLDELFEVALEIDYRKPQLPALDDQIEAKNKGFKAKLKEYDAAKNKNLKEIQSHFDNLPEGVDGEVINKAKQEESDKWDLKRKEWLDKHLEGMPKEFQKKYREALEERSKVVPAYKAVWKKINEHPNKDFTEAMRKAELKREEAEKKRQAELKRKGGQKETEDKGSGPKKKAESDQTEEKPESDKKAAPEKAAPGGGASVTELLALKDGAGSPSGAGKTRNVALNVDAEPKQGMVVALTEEDAIASAMQDELLASLATNAFSIGQQQIVQLAVPRQQTDEVSAYLKGKDWVSWFEPDPCWSKQEVDDPYFNSEGLWDQKYDDQWAIKRAGFTEETISAARDNGDAKPVTVAIIDTGVDWFHPDLDEKSLWRNENEIPDNGIDDDGNGYVDDVIGWNFIDQSNKPWDYDGHGTFIAGVIGAASGNGTGITGVNPHARIMPLKALDPFGQGYASQVAEAIMYAADNGAKVINISLGGKGISRVVDLAIDHAVSQGALVVVAAGNEATDVSGFGPAGSAGVITVSATDQRDRRAGFSNWGEEVDISAPGVDVMSLRARNTDLLSVIRGVEYDKGSAIVGDSRAYYRASGTSFAAPIVSGAASLIMSMNPDLDAHAVRRMLLNSARDIETPGIDNYVGYGLLDVDAALKADPKHSVESRITGARPERVDGKSVLRLTGTADADDFADATLSLGKGKEPEKWLTIKKRIIEPVQDGVLMDIPAAALSGSKEWTVRLITRHKDGTERESRFVVTLG